MFVHGGKRDYRRSEHMVNSGNKILESDLTSVDLDGERIRLPAHLADKAGLSGPVGKKAWLLVMAPGRYRLVTKTPEEDSDLSRLIQYWKELGETGSALDVIDSSRAAMRARVIAIVVSPPPPGWRISLPKALLALVPKTEDRSRVLVFPVAGCIEFWFPDTFKRFGSTPFSDLLP